MAMKIKWNDDRVRGAATAVLLIGRDRLSRGKSSGLVRAALAEYRADPDGYKRNKAAWPDAREPGPLADPRLIAAYRNLVAAVDALLLKFTRAKRHFNSVLELDNALIEHLEMSGSR